MTSTLKRVATALVLLAVFVPAVLWAPAWLWAVLMAGVLAVAAHEWGRMSHFPASAARAYAALLALAALALPTLVPAHWPTAEATFIAAGVGFWLVAAPAWLAFGWRAEQPLARAAVGAIVLLPTWTAFLYLHAKGAAVLLGVMVAVWIADSAAYFAGRRFGRRKLAPSISPGKTWEGVAGALAALSLYAGVVAVASDLPLVPLLFLAAGLLYVSILGDLFESWIKRVSGMKDSGDVLPGHGGVLDRIDALTSTLPIATGILMWLERSV